jgi:hypothetical protein
MTNSFYEFFDGLLADLKAASTTNWGGGHEPFRPMTSTVEQIVQKHLAGIDPDLRQSFSERVAHRLKLLAAEDHEYADALRMAANHLA